MAAAAPKTGSLYDRNMLPILGVCWHRFSTLRDAMAFAKWAEKTTRKDQYPCDAYVLEDDGEYEVKVVNW